MAEVKWIKLTTDMFDNRKLKHLRRLPDGNSIVLIWVMLLTMAGRCNSGGMIFLTENIPYTAKMLADELDFEENTVKLALSALESLNMIVTNGDFFSIAGWEEYQNIDRLAEIREYNRLAQQKSREKRKALAAVNDKSLTSQRCHETDIDKEEDKEIRVLSKDNTKKKAQKRYAEGDELNDAIISFIEYRKGMKKPMTDKAVALMLDKLGKMASTDRERVEILNQSIINGWQGVFELKEDARRKATQHEREAYADMDKYMNWEDKKTAGNDAGVKAKAEALRKELGGY